MFRLSVLRDCPNALDVHGRRARCVSLGDRSIPIGEDGGGNQIFMDTSTVPPSVKLAVFEGAVSNKPVAPSLSDFLALLHVDPDFI
jgi:hypothetical protein